MDSRGRTGAVVGVVAGVFVGLLLGFVLDAEPGRQPSDEGLPSTASEVGPTNEVEGVPTGYARTEEGAIAAATNFNLLSGKNELFSEAALVRAMKVLAAPSWTEEAARQGRNGYEFVSSTYGSDADLTAAVMRYELVDFSEDTATVKLWVVTALTGSGRPNVESTWGIVTTNLQWIDDDWRITSVESSPGPAPVELPSNQPDSTAHKVMEAFDEFSGAPAP